MLLDAGEELLTALGPPEPAVAHLLEVTERVEAEHLEDGPVHGVVGGVEVEAFDVVAGPHQVDDESVFCRELGSDGGLGAVALHVGGGVRERLLAVLVGTGDDVFLGLAAENDLHVNSQKSV